MPKINALNSDGRDVRSTEEVALPRRRDSPSAMLLVAWAVVLLALGWGIYEAVVIAVPLLHALTTGS